MNCDVKLACALTEALIKDKNSEEIARLQITLQTVCSLLASELACRKTKDSIATREGSPRQ